MKSLLLISATLMTTSLVFAQKCESGNDCCKIDPNLLNDDDTFECETLIEPASKTAEEGDEVFLTANPRIVNGFSRCEWKAPTGKICKFNQDTGYGDACDVDNDVTWKGNALDGVCAISIYNVEKKTDDGRWRVVVWPGYGYTDSIDVVIGDNGMSKSAVVGVSVTAAIIGLILIILLFFLWRRHRKNKKEKSKEKERRTSDTDRNLFPLPPTPHSDTTDYPPSTTPYPASTRDYRLTTPTYANDGASTYESVVYNEVDESQVRRDADYGLEIARKVSNPAIQVQRLT